jgi:O-antigen/teichoic acid export membrane protein
MESVRFGVPLMLGELGYLSLSYIDRYLIQLSLGSVAVGIYAAGYNLSNYVTDVIMYPIAFAITPIYMEVFVKKGEKETKEFLSRVLGYFLLVMIPLSLGFIALSKNLIVILATSKYLESNMIIPYVIIGQSIYACALILRIGLFIKKKTYIIRNIMFVACLIKVGLNLLLIPIYGILGAGIATLVTYIIYAVAVTYYSFKEFSFWIDYKRILIYVTSAVAMFLAVKNVQLGSHLVELIIKSGIGILVYSAFILFLDKEIRNRFLDLLKTSERG